MQEHIRRAHPEHYISKLPATEESFLLMINTPPSERRHPEQSPASGAQGLPYLKRLFDALLTKFQDSTIDRFITVTKEAIQVHPDTQTTTAATAAPCLEPLELLQHLQSYMGSKMNETRITRV